MVYIQGLADQTEIFLCSLGFGFLLGILYDVFRILRIIFMKSKSFTFFADLLYFAVCAFLTFCFIMVVDSGRVRLYVALGEILGWLIYYFSFGAIAIRLTNAVAHFLKYVFNTVSKLFKRIFGRIFSKLKKIALFFKKIIRKNNKKVKFNLQKHRGMVYNLYSYIKNNKLVKKEKADDC